LVSKGWILQVIGSVFGWGYFLGSVLDDVESLLQGLVLKRVAESLSSSILDEKHDHISPVEQEFSGGQFFGLELGLEVNSVIAQNLVFDILVDFLNRLSTEVATFLC
jgi:hypothetical protein